MTLASRTLSALRGEPRTVRAVGWSPDLSRVVALPRRPQALPSAAECEALSVQLRAPNPPPDAPCAVLRPVQAQALLELRATGGLLGPIGCGEGKTLLSLLAPTVVGAVAPVLVVPAALVAKTLRDAAEARKFWRVPPATGRGALTVVSYEALSSPERGPELLRRLAPDLLVADEAHALRHTGSTRSRRVLRFLLEDAPGCRVVFLSGTLIARSLADMAHLAAVALGDGSPLPLDPTELRAWCEAVDEDVEPLQRRAPGALLEVLPPAANAPVGDVRARVHERIVTAPGVVATVDALPTGLEVSTVWANAAHVPGALCWPGILEACQRATASGCDPDGNPADDPADVARLFKALSLGFWYRWRWPGGRPDVEWMAARSRWWRSVGAWLEAGPPEGLDSPALVARACARGEAPSDGLAGAWARWAPVRHRPPPPVEPVWFSGEALAWVEAWAWAHPEGLVWTEHVAVLEALRGRGLTCAGANEQPPRAPGIAAVVLSRQAHGQGHNLQPWSSNLVTAPPSSAAAWEQMLARTHRPGQLADVVRVEVLLAHGAHARAWEAALAGADYLTAVTGQPQRLSRATMVAP